MSVNGFLEQLAGGDRRSIGRVPQVVRQVFEELGLVAELFSGLGHDDAVVRMRARRLLTSLEGRRKDIA